jgi:hypothetical protein
VIHLMHADIGEEQAQRRRQALKPEAIDRERVSAGGFE